MRKFGLIGYPLSHSFSKKYFSDKFNNESIQDCSYDLFPIEDVALLPALIGSNPEFCGLNVTIPYKKSILPFLDEIDSAATAIGAVNCISVKQVSEGFYLKGYNTDVYGFQESLMPLLKPGHKKALVLGNGGAAQAVKYALHTLGLDFKTVSRSPVDDGLRYGDLDEALLAEYTVIINTTPLGMSPDILSCPDLPYSVMDGRHLVYDLVYNPEETVFLKKSAVQGATIKNGMEMLYLQAERSWDIWNS